MSLVERIYLLFALFAVGLCYYDEKLVLQPLPGQHLLSSFQIKLQSGWYDNSSLLREDTTSHHGIFPKEIASVLDVTNTKELHLRFAQGWYDSEAWGALPYNGSKSGGSGVELWAIMSSDSQKTLDKKWAKLVNSLSALFCASFNFIDSSITTFPKKSFQSSRSESNVFISGDEDLYLLRSALPREPVCTENLTPFLKLIPTKGKAGITSLLDGHKVYDSQWNSMSIDIMTVYDENGSYYYDMDLTIDIIMNVPKRLESNKNPIIKPIDGAELVCDETKKHDAYVCFPLMNKGHLEIDLKSIFGKEVAGSVPLADNWSKVCTSASKEEWEFNGVTQLEKGLGEVGHAIYSMLSNETCYHLDEQKPYNFIIKSKQPSQKIDVQAPPIEVTRSLSSYSQGPASMRTVFQNFNAEPAEVIYFESLPWFLRVYLSSLTITGTEIDDVYYSPSKDRLRPTHLELKLTVPANTTVRLNYEFDKSLLLLAEYPPDANHGFDIEPSVVTLTKNDVPVYEMRTTSLLMTLPTPDFSMPYNVIILTGTVTSLVFGAIFQMLFKKVITVEEYEILLKKHKPLDKLKAKIQNLKFKLGLSSKSIKKD